MPNGEQHEAELHISEHPKRRVRGVAKPAGEKRQRRTSTQAKIALAMVETHLAGVYGHMKLLEQSINTLKEQLS